MKQPLTALFLSGLLSFGLNSQLLSAESAPPAGAEVIQVRIGQVGGGITLGGTVIPRKQVKLSAQIPGDVKAIAGEEGDHFSAGTALVQLDTSAMQAKRTQALTQLASAEAGYRNAIVQYNRELTSPNGMGNSMLGGAPGMMSMFTDPMRSVTGQGNPGYERYSGVVGQRTQVETARNQIEQARAAIRELDDNIENATSRAPFDGVIVAKMVEQGDIVQPGMPLVTFADISRMQIQVQVPSRLIGRLQEGATFKARLDRSDQQVDVTVARIFPMAKQGGHTTTVKFDLPPAVKAQSGTYAEVSIASDETAANALPMVPQSAIVWRGSLPAVYLVGPEGQLKMKVLRTGSVSSDGWVTVISGVKQGDRILKRPTPGTRSTPQG